MAHLLRWCRLVSLQLAVFETATGAECRAILPATAGESWEHLEIRRLARALREQRLERRITLLWLAGAWEISRSSIKRWEQAASSPPWRCAEANRTQRNSCADLADTSPASDAVAWTRLSEISFLAISAYSSKILKLSDVFSAGERGPGCRPQRQRDYLASAEYVDMDQQMGPRRCGRGGHRGCGIAGIVRYGQI